MPKYEVKLPISGYAVVEVEADSEAEAISAGFDEVYSHEQIEEWTALTHVVQGNVWCGLGSPRASARQIDGECQD